MARTVESVSAWWWLNLRRIERLDACMGWLEGGDGVGLIGAL